MLRLYVINYFELSNIGVIARRLNSHISNRSTLNFVPHLPQVKLPVDLSECLCFRGVLFPPFLRLKFAASRFDLFHSFVVDACKLEGGKIVYE